MKWNLKSDRPIYIQLVEQIKIRIISGEFKPGEKLPSVRDMAAEATVNPNTMQKALMELERCGVIYAQRTVGRYITEDKQMLEELKNNIAKERVAEFIDNMKSFGFESQDILQLINKMIKSDN